MRQLSHNSQFVKVNHYICSDNQVANDVIIVKKIK